MTTNQNAFLTAVMMSLSLPAGAKNLSIAGYFGANPLEFTVSETGKVKVLNYPKALDGKINVIQFPTTGLFKDLTAATCDKVEAQGKLYKDPLTPAAAKERVFETIRTVNPVVVKWDVAFRLQPETILTAVKIYLRDKELPHNNLVLQNQVVLSKAAFKIEADNDGVTRHLGALAEVEKGFAEKFSAGIVKTGSATGEVATMDLLCDAKHGKAKLTVSVTGIEAGSEKGRLVVDEAAGKELVEGLIRNKDNFAAGDDRAEYGVNRVRVTAQVLSVMGRRGVTLSEKDLIFLVNALSDAQTGRPLNLEGIALNKELTVFETGNFAYEGNSAITF